MFTTTSGGAITERLRIDSSGNVGIGTNSPHALLHVDGGDVKISSDSATSNGDGKPTIFFSESGADEVYAQISYHGDDESGTNNFIGIGCSGAVGTTEALMKENHQMVVKASGNVGIGTSSPAFQFHLYNSITGAAQVEGGSRADIFLVDSGSTTNQKRQTLRSDGGSFIIGTENDARTAFTEKMRIDSSGNLLVGTTDSDTGNAGSSTGIALGSVGYLTVARNGATPIYANRLSSDGEVISIRKDGSTKGSIGINSTRPYIASTDTGVRFVNDDIRPTNGSGVDTDGTKDLGDAAVRFKDLYLSGGIYSGNPTNTAGNLFLHIDGDADGVSTGYKIRSGVGVTTGSSHIAFVNPNGIVGQIRTDGSATSYNTSSDERLKQNIQDADDAGSKIDAIQVRQFDWKIDGTHESYGVIAQELQSVAPEAVSGNPESEEMMGVDYSKLVPTLIKEIQTLRNRVAQLENN